MPIDYRLQTPVTVDDVIALYMDSGLKRPVEDPARIAAMYANAGLVVSARDADRLVGVARSVTDQVYCCYLSDLAVLKAYQGTGIGRELIARTRAHLGEGCMVLLLSAPGAMTYYPAIGMEEVKNGFIFNRNR